MAALPPEAVEASDSSTPSDRLDELADDHPELRPLLVVNPSLSEATRQWILDNDPAARPPWERLQAEQARSQQAAEQQAARDQARQEREQQLRDMRESAQQAEEPDHVDTESAAPQFVPVRGVAPPVSRPSRNRSGCMRWGCGCCAALVLLWVIVSVGGGLLRSITSSSSDSSSDTTTSSRALASPAPSGASEQTLIQSPRLNIGCELTESRVGCSVTERAYASAGLKDCPASDRNFSIAVAEGKAALTCATEYVGSPGDAVHTLDYGTTAVKGETACTSRKNGMTCWNQRTGHGFTVSRSTYTTF